MLLSDQIVGVIVGGSIGFLSGLGISYANIWWKDRNTKKYTVRAFLEEVEENQKRLRPLYQLYIAYKDYPEGEGKSSKNDASVEQETITSPKSISFDRTIYSNLSGNIGLLNSKIRDKLVQYYVRVKPLEEQYKYLEEIHGCSPADLVYLEINYQFGGTWSEQSNKYAIFKKIDEFLSEVEETYIIGNELLKSLKEQNLKIMPKIERILSLKRAPHSRLP